ncbi:hypothetical protein QFZ20_004599 [Flavobacterium sp. W4I14]|nr:hypothetical protein [Flavobacterium sp. W4I14]
MTNESQQINTGEVNLKELILKIREWWNYLVSKWFIILLSGLVGGVLGFCYTFTKKPIYTATTTFVLEDEKSGGGLGNLMGLASVAGVDLGGTGGGIFQGDNILQLYKSRTMIQKTLLTKVVDNGQPQLLVDRYILINKLKEDWKNKPKLLALNFSNLLDQKADKDRRIADSLLRDIVNDIDKDYLVVSKPDKKVSTIQVDVKSKDEFFAKAFNDELVKNVNDFYITTKTKKTTQNVKILQQKADSVRAVMNGEIYTATAVLDATPNLNPTRQVQRVAPAQKAQFSAETNKAILGEMVKNLEMTKMSLLREAPLIQVIDQPIFPLRKDKLGKAKAIVIGGILAGFLICFLLIFKRTLKLILS